jgi:hypothetical protein
MSSTNSDGEYADAVEIDDAAAAPVDVEANDQPIPGGVAVVDESNATNVAVWKLKFFACVLVLDAFISVIVLSPFWPYMRHVEDASSSFHHYSLYRSLIDLSILAAARISAAVLAILICYLQAKLPPENPRYDHFDLYHPNGDRKSREQLEQEALEEPFGPWLLRFLRRPALATEVLAVLAQAIGIVKCLVRMNVEMGTFQDAHRYHPVFWLAILATALLSAVEATYLEDVCKVAGQYGHERLGGAGRTAASLGMLRSFSSQLLAPLLEHEHSNGEAEEEEAPTEEDSGVPEENMRATSDITADPAYKASWTDLLSMCYPDTFMILAAFVFLLLAAVAQVLIPKYLGNILDALAAAFGNPDDDSRRHMSMWEVPHFMSNVKLLVMVSILAGVFAGLRGSIFVSAFCAWASVFNCILISCLMLHSLLDGGRRSSQRALASKVNGRASVSRYRILRHHQDGRHYFPTLIRHDTGR